MDARNAILAVRKRKHEIESDLGVRIQAAADEMAELTGLPVQQVEVLIGEMTGRDPRYFVVHVRLKMPVL